MVLLGFFRVIHTYLEYQLLLLIHREVCVCVSFTVCLEVPPSAEVSVTPPTVTVYPISSTGSFKGLTLSDCL